MISDFDKAVNGNVFAFASYAARYNHYDKQEKFKKPRTLFWFSQKYGVKFVVFNKIKESGKRQRACVLCNNSYLRLKYSDGRFVYDDEIDTEEFDAGKIYPVW